MKTQVYRINVRAERHPSRRVLTKSTVNVVPALASFFADLMPYLGCWRAAKILHALLLENVLKAPLQFFEVTPLGRILSRFSKDVDIMDTSLPTQASDVIYCAFEVMSVFNYYFFIYDCRANTGGTRDMVCTKSHLLMSSILFNIFPKYPFVAFSLTTINIKRHFFKSVIRLLLLCTV